MYRLNKDFLVADIDSWLNWLFKLFLIDLNHPFGLGYISHFHAGILPLPAISSPLLMCLTVVDMSP